MWYQQFPEEFRNYTRFLRALLGAPWGLGRFSVVSRDLVSFYLFIFYLFIDMIEFAR